MSVPRIALACLPVFLLEPHPSLARTDFPELQGDPAAVCQTAFERSRQPYVEVAPEPLPEFDPPPDGAKNGLGVVFDEYGHIRSLRSIYRDRFHWVNVRPRGNVHKEPVEVWIGTEVAGDYRPVRYKQAMFDYGSSFIQPPLPTRIPAAARVITALELGARLGRTRSWPQFAYLGGSGYVRLAGLDTAFGTSLRLTAYNVGEVESKPRLTKLYLRPLSHHRFALQGVVESGPFTACMQAVTTAGLTTQMQTTLRLYPRPGYVAPPGARVSPIALSSMFWKGATDTPADPTDQAHDADTMMVCGQPAAPLRDWVPSAVPAGRPAFHDFGLAPCFGLMQLDRTPAHYTTYDSANYANRVNLWVGDLEADLDYSVKLMTMGSNYEGEDNVVAYAEFKDELPFPLTADDGATFSYTVTVSALPPPKSGQRSTRGHAPAVGTPVVSGRAGSVQVFSRPDVGLTNSDTATR